MIDPLLSLSMTMHSSPGIFALLIGSGVSRAAKIPTGWDIVVDLVQKLARLRGEDCGPDAAKWYHEKYGKEPDYSDLLGQIGKTAAERQQLLRSYFEPTDEERDEGLKQPTAAHHGIANLVSGGHCRIIVTTNFDHLLEEALEAKGIPPTVVSTPDAVKGMAPLAHQRCCLVKLNGDYLDTRIKNTPAELSEYDEATNQLLDQIFDEYGLIVCGWSAQWDTALRAAIERCHQRRFSVWWTARGELVPEAKKLVALRDAQLVRIEDADKFWSRLSEFVTSLEDSKREHPLSIEAAASSLKRYMSEPRYAIKLEDFVLDATEDAQRKLTAYNKELLETSQQSVDVNVAFKRYEEIVEILEHIMIHGCALGGAGTHELWIRVLEKTLSCTPSERYTLTDGLRHYSTARLLYAGGLAAAAKKRYQLIGTLLAEPTVRPDKTPVPLLLALGWTDLHELAKQVEGLDNQWAPRSDYLFETLRGPLARYYFDDAEYEECFDRFEYLLCLAYADLRNRARPKSHWWAPIGRFGWRLHRVEPSIITIVGEEVEVEGNDWPLYECGLFNGSLARFTAVRDGVNQFIGQLNWC